MKMKVITVVTVATSAWSLLRGQLAWLQQRGHHITLVTSPGDVFKATLEREEVNGCAVEMEREINPRKDWVSLKELISVFKREKPDVINVSTPKAGLLGGIAGVISAVPVRIYTLRGLRMETARGPKRMVLWLAEWIACACAHKVVCVSPSLRDRAVELRLVSSRKAVVLGGGSSNGVLAQRFEPTPERSVNAMNIRHELGILESSIVYGFVGRFTRDKGILELLDAFLTVSTDHPEAKLLLVGDFETGDPIPDNARQQLEQHPSIICTGFVQDTSPYYHVLDVLVLPSHREGFPNVPLEAASAAKAVITTNATGARDAVVDGVTGLIVPVGDAKALGRAMIQLLLKPEQTIAFGHVGRERILREFTPEVIWHELEILFLTTLQERFKTASNRALSLQKRLFDIVVSAIGLVVLSPLLFVVVVLIRVNLGSPVFFQQVRPGLHGYPFMMFKFRSMKDLRDTQGSLLPDGQRLTSFGQFLRSSSLDELPGLWNVLNGDMSLVGPRPLLMRYLERYTPEQARRHDVRPGITGWAQVNGRNAISWEEKFALDVWYVEHQSFWLDMKILLLTVLKVFRREGISAAGDATMPEFSGSDRD
jgi:lipopolysaccharide/colanic/teichoic acid biosynthesis glycosyltransferase/glycosyltransferase involved in cell wall biosynthesis